MIYVGGEEHGRPNVDMTDRMRGNLMSNSSVTFFNLKKHFASTTIEAMWFCGQRPGYGTSRSRFLPSLFLSCVNLDEPPNSSEPQSPHL